MLETLTNSIIDFSNHTLSINELKSIICKSESKDKINFIYLGKHSYKPVWSFQKDLFGQARCPRCLVAFSLTAAKWR